MPKLRFDGSIRWICPHCKAENDTIKVLVRIEGITPEMNFQLDDDDVNTGVLDKALDALDRDEEPEYPEMEEIWDYQEEEYICPFCYQQVTAGHIREGFHKWLERLKDKDPEQYAELLSGCFEE